MTVRKPLVIANGQIEQLQAGDTISVPDFVQQTADATLIAGAAVYQSAADHVNKAQANALSTSQFTGLAVAAITSGASGGIQNNGILAMTTTQWDAVAGTTGGLVFGQAYYLSPTTASFLTSTAPTTVGQTVVQVGIGISTTEILISTNPLVVLL